MEDLILWKTSYHKKVLCLLQGMMINLMKKNLIEMQVPKIIKWLGTQVRAQQTSNRNIGAQQTENMAADAQNLGRGM